MFVEAPTQRGDPSASEMPAAPEARGGAGDAGSGPDAAQPSELETEHLEHQIEQLAARLAADTCRWLELIAEFDRRQGWWRWGTRSCAHWVSWRCSVSLRAAREHLRVAHTLTDLPGIRDAFARGELSYSKVRALTRVASAESETELLELATHATAAQLEKLIRVYRRVSRAEANDALAHRYFATFWEPDGSLYLHGRLPAEQGALLMAALEAGFDALRAAHEGEDDEGGEGGERDGDADPPGADLPQTGDSRCSAEHLEPDPRARPTYADALVQVAEAALDDPSRSLSAPKRSELVVHVELNRLVASEAQLEAGAEPEGSCHLRDGPAISVQTARRLGCDGALRTIVERQGRPLGVGRRTRAIPTAIRSALEARDGGCRFPGCQNHRFVEAHHIRHWAAGGETAADNLILLCGAHHRLLHEGGYRMVTGDDGTLRFFNSGGFPLDPPRPRALPPPSPAAASRPRAGPLRTGTGEHMDLGYAVDAVYAALQPPTGANPAGTRARPRCETPSARDGPA